MPVSEYSSQCQNYANILFTAARGFFRAGLGTPNEAQSARYILKDYVNAKLVFCHPPPEIDEQEFNAAIYEKILRKAAKINGGVTAVHPGSKPVGRAGVLDNRFFDEKGGLSARAFVNGQEFDRGKQYPHQNMVTSSGELLTAKHARLASVLERQGANFNSKKHHKKMKREKQRGGGGYD
jgi:large subunit GTPase 1